jgi:hypothetical protein
VWQPIIRRTTFNSLTFLQEDDEDISSTINEIEERARRAKEAAEEVRSTAKLKSVRQRTVHLTITIATKRQRRKITAWRLDVGPT